MCCSGGGDAPDNEARKVLNSYDGTKEHMRRIVDTMFVDKKWAADDSYIERRWELANLPGAWEATAAARFKAPFREAGRDRSARDNIPYGDIAVPALVFAGRHDPLRLPGYTDGFVPFIPNAAVARVRERRAHGQHRVRGGIQRPHAEISRRGGRGLTRSGAGERSDHT